jgi:hypothetical protein
MAPSWFLDEIQLVPGWERFVRRVLDTERVEMVVKGLAQRSVVSSQSNAAVQNTIGAMPSQCPSAPSARVNLRNAFVYVIASKRSSQRFVDSS